MNYRRWTATEEEILKRYVRASPTNLAKCFIYVAEEIERSPTAVANHWYSKTSKDPNFWGFFTASAQHVSKNRKNGEGVESSNSIWNRLLRIVKSLYSGQ